MYAGAHINKYKSVNVQTASPGQLLVALYETAIRYARQAAGSIRAGNVVAKGREIQRVADLITELASTLNRDVAPELCDNLEQLYFYMGERLSESNATMTPEPVEEVARLMETLKEAWIQAVDQVEGRRAQSTEMANAASNP